MSKKKSQLSVMIESSIFNSANKKRKKNNLKWPTLIEWLLDFYEKVDKK